MANLPGIAFFAAIVLTLVVVVVAWFDLRERRIPNLIVFPAALIGLGLNVVQGWDGLWFGVKGLLLGLALLFVPHLLGAMGAGDVKFLAAIGAFVGGTGVIRVLLLSLMVYPVLALGFLLQQRKLTLTLRRFARLTSKLFGVFIPPLRFYAAQLEARDNPEEASATTPFGLAITIGTLLALYTNFLR
ncbi:MAG TPA: A24 family peptidase [Blastocatellia bacterium]|nr:A24 family peptidase [Blastocatellia bacterium]